MIKCYYRSLWLLLFSFCVFNVHAQYFKNLGMKDGLSNPSVLAIYQDTLGRMWFGTREGVNIYDGKQIKDFKTSIVRKQKVYDHYFPGTEVDRIVGDANGDVFMRVERSLVKYDIRKETFYTLRESNVGAVTSCRGEIWCTIRDSLFRYDPDVETLCFIRKFPFSGITCILLSDQKLWVGTVHGLYLFEKDVMKTILPNVEIFRIFESSRHELWIASRMRGLYSIKRDGILRKMPNSKDHVISNQIREFVEDEQQNIWFGTFEGLQVYNPYTDTFRSFSTESRPGSLSHSSVFSLYKDWQGTIWIGTYYGGVNYFNQSKDIFLYYAYNEERTDCLNYPFVGDMLEDHERNLWICTDGGGINCLNRKTGKFTYYTASHVNSILHNNVKTIAYDEKRGYLYIGTYTGGMSRYDQKAKKFYNYMVDGTTKKRGPDEIICHMIFRNDKLYVSARNGLWVLDPDTDQFELLNNEDLFLTFDIDSKDNVWLATRTDLFRMSLQTPSVLKRFELDSLGIKCRVTKILESTDGLVYIATLGNGLRVYDYSSDKLTAYTMETNDLLSNYCYNLAVSPRDNLLITSDKGVSLFSPLTKSIHSIKLGLKGGISAISDGCGIFVSRDEQIFIGGVDGMAAFREEDLYMDRDDKDEFYFSDLYIDNVRIYPEDETGILKNSLPFTHKLKLSAKQNNLIVNFSSSNYVDILKNTWYQYKLDGFDDDWIPITETSLRYTNLPPGHYVLRVREMGYLLNMHESKEKEIALDLVITTPWYNTIGAWLFYIAFVIMAVYWIWKVKMTRKILSLSLANEKIEKERIEEVNQMKLRFFTNISHEFRTPLTLIIGQIETLLQLDKFPLSVQRRLLRVHKNAMHLRYLITELLDFRKQEQGFLKLKVERVDMVGFVREVYQSFDDYAKRKKIEYVFEHVDKSIDVWFDPAQMQKVIFNLLSNAFKYTVEGDSIKVGIRKLQQTVEIMVMDSGCGISKEFLSNIFDRFYQVNNDISASMTGTGIGLALVKGIIDLHKGNIEVDSELDKGSVFKVYLPLGNKHFTPEELEHEKIGYAAPIWDAMTAIDEEVEKETIEKEEKPLVPGTEKPTILLVEDDAEILEMLEGIFLPTYNVYKADNGEEGFNRVCQLQPDIVVSDVMMPVMSGKEMCYKMKNSVELSYIPIVLLTAQDSVEHMIEGYMFGADDYITKPFHVQLLLARCNNLVKGRKALLKKSVLGEEQDSAALSDGLNSEDRRLIEKVVRIIKDNFDNPDFDMNTLATEINMGRSRMFARLKEATGLTPNEFTLKLKLEEATRILREEPEYNITEISYRLGFSSLRYFSRCFKTFYGVTPQNYKKKLR